MIENFGLGIDISNIEKFRNKPFNENESFYRKIFSEEEIQYCLKFKNYYEKFAHRQVSISKDRQIAMKTKILPEFDQLF